MTHHTAIPDFLVIGVWAAVALGVVPRYVRSLAWVTNLVMISGFGIVWLMWSLDADPIDGVFRLPFRMGSMFVVTFLAMFLSEAKFRRQHGWWRWLDGETGRRPPSHGDSATSEYQIRSPPGARR
jgi:hypothetical protein